MTGPLLPPARRPQIALAVVALTYLSCVAGTVPTFHLRTSDVITFVAVGGLWPGERRGIDPAGLAGPAAH